MTGGEIARVLQIVVELDGAELLEQDGEPEDREREAQEGSERDCRSRSGCTGGRGGDDADDEPEEIDNDRGQQHEPERDLDGRGEDRPDVLALLVDAEVESDAHP